MNIKIFSFSTKTSNHPKDTFTIKEVIYDIVYYIAISPM